MPERLSAVFCLLLAAALWIGPFVLRVDLFYDDVAHHVFWLYQISDPTLFPNDLTIEYFHTSAPWGYRALYAVVVPYVDALTAAKCLAVGLLAVTGLLAWKIGTVAASDRHDLHGLLAVVAVIALLPLSQQRDLLPPIALQRTFALPLEMFTLWALMSRRYLWVGASWVMAALFYPVVLPVQGLTAALVFLRETIVTRRLPPHWGTIALAGIVALSLAAFGMPIPADVGPALTYEQAVQMPEFGPGGRLDLYAAGLVGNWFTGHRTGLGWSPMVLVLFAAAVVLSWKLGRLRDIPFAAWTMASVGVGLWVAMRLLPAELMFGLYLPNRHSRWAVGVFGVLALAAAAAASLDYAVRWKTGNGPAKDPTDAGRVTAKWVAALAPLFVAAVLLPNAARVWQHPVNTDLENTYRFISTLPVETLVAAHPDLANFVPVRSRRSVLTSTEVSMAWMQGYYTHMKPRVEASLRAAYATRIEDVDAALGPYGVDVMLTGPDIWTKQEYFPPFDGLFKNLIASGTRDGFVLRDPPADRILFRSGEYYVIRVGECQHAECR